VPGIRYVGFIDASSGRSDSYTAAIASRDGDLGILHSVIEIPAPADPVKATATVAAAMRNYSINQVWGDRYAVGFVAAELGRHGLTLQHTTKSRSDLYRELLPALRSQRIRLLDSERAVSQFAALERRALSAGGERIDHPANGKDDLSNAIAGALVMAATPVSSADGWLEYLRRQTLEAGIERDDIRASGPQFGFEIGPSKEPERLFKLFMPKPIEAGGGRSGIQIDGYRYMPRFEGTPEGMRATIDVPRAAALQLLAHDLWRADNTVVARELVGDGAS
jgi:hypothetical protein